MRGLRGVEGGGALAAAVAVAVASLAVLVPAGAGSVLMAAHAEQGGAGAEPGMIVVADRGNNRLQVFYPDGTFAFVFAEFWGAARAIDIAPDGRIMVSYGGSVNVFHPNGTYAFYVGSGSGYGIGAVGDGARAAFAPDGRIVVVDGWIDYDHNRVHKRVQVFSPDGEFESVFDPGGDRHNFLHDVAVAPNGLIIAADGGSGVRAFHLDGTEHSSFTFGSYPVHVAVGPDGEIVTVEGGYSDALRVYRPNVTLSNGTALVYAPALDIERTSGWPGSMSDVAVGADGRIVVGDSENNTVSVFHSNGTRVMVDHSNGTRLALTFGGYGSVQGGFDRPTDAAVGPDGRIVVAEPGKNAISVFHPNGTLAFSFGSRGSGDDAFYEPHQVAVGHDGRIVVGDTRKHRILVFEPDGSPALAFGSQGYGAGQISNVRDVAVAPNGSVVVVDHTPRVQVFSPDGAFMSVLDPRGDPWSCWAPVRAAVGPDGKIVVVDECEVVRAFHPNGTMAFYIELEPGGATDSGIDVGPDGRIVVVQDSRSQVFNPDGTFAFATEIDVDAVSVAVGPNREIVVVDDDANRVQVFNPDGTFAFSLLPDLSEGKFKGIGAIAVGPVMLRHVGDPAALWTSIEPEEGGDDGAPILRNFTGAGDAANVTIDVAALAGGPGGADALNGSESSTVTFPASNTTVIASFAEVTFPPNVTASHVPAGGLLGLRVATLVPTAEQVQAALGRSVNGSGPELVVILQSVVEIGGDQSRIMFDLPIRIALEGQAGGRAFYIEGPNGTIVPIDLACATDGVDAVHRQLGGAGECQMDSADGAKIIHTYHLTKFGTVSAEGPVPGIVVDRPRPRPAAPDGGSNSTNGTAGPPQVGPIVVPQGPPTSFPGGGGVNATNGTVAPPPPPPVVVVPDPGGHPTIGPSPAGQTCSVYLADPEFALTAMPGGYSDPFIQEVANAGTLPFAQVEIEATPWQDAAMPLPAAPRPPLAPGASGPSGTAPSVFTAYLLATMPASVTEVREEPREPRVVGDRLVAGGGGGQYVPLADGTAVVGRGLEAGNWAQLSFRLNLTPYDALQGGTLTQSITYQAECVEPAATPPAPRAPDAPMVVPPA